MGKRAGGSKKKIVFQKNETQRLLARIERIEMQGQAALHNVLLLDRMINELFPALSSEWKDNYIKKQKEAAGIPTDMPMSVTTDETVVGEEGGVPVVESNYGYTESEVNEDGVPQIPPQCCNSNRRLRRIY